MRRHRFLTDFSLVGFGVGAARACSVLTLVILVRRLGPSAFGLFSLGWVVYQAISQAISGLDIGFVDLQSRRLPGESLETDYRRLKLWASAALGVVAVIGALLIGVVLGWSGAEIAVGVSAGTGGAVWAFFQTNLSCLQAERRFAAFAGWTIGFNAGVLLAVCGLVVIGIKSPTAYLATYLIVGVVACAIATRSARSSPLLAPSSPEGWKSILRHSRWLTVSSVLFAVGERAELLIAGALLASYEVGIYAAPARLFGILALALSAMGTVLLPHASHLSGRDNLIAYVRNAALVTAGVGAVGILAVWQAEPLTRIVLGQKYLAADKLIPAFAVAGVLLTANSILMYLLFSLKKPGTFALMNGAVLVTKLATAALLIPALKAEGAAWSLVASYSVGIIIVLATIGRHRAVVTEDLRHSYAG